jgi:non-specific serine/threonine protein kinase
MLRESCVRGSLAARRGDPESGLDPLRHGLAEMQEASYLLFYPFFKAELAVALGAAGRVDDGLAEIDGAMRFAEVADYRLFMPEILRIKGELLALRSPEDAAIIQDLFLRSINMARDQQALYWELCAATNLAGLLRGQQRDPEARLVLASVYDQLAEGFSAPRVRQAKALLDQMA